MPWYVPVAVLLLLLVVHGFYMIHRDKANRLERRFGWAKPAILGLVTASFSTLPLCFGGESYDRILGACMIGLGLGSCVVAFLQRPTRTKDRRHHSDHGNHEEGRDPG